MDSIWTMTADLKKRKPLEEDITVEAAVIGGGLAGILTAYFLQKQGVHAIVLEAARIGSGQTGRTTAKITVQHGLIYDKLIRGTGREKTRQYADAARQAVCTYRTIIEGQQIDCSFRNCSSYLYTCKDITLLAAELEAAQSLGISAELTDKTELPFPVCGALQFYDQAVFHPLLFLKAIAEDLEIYEDTKVLEVEGNEIMTTRAKVQAKHIIFACHYPIVNAPGYYFLRMHQERSYVLALQNTKQMDHIYFGVDEDGLSFRKNGNILLLGGQSHRTGENKKGGSYTALRAEAAKLFPDCRETAWWSAQDCMPQDNIPYIGRYSASTPDWYVATGFRKWGMTGSMVSALIITDLIIKGYSPYEEVFSPQRFNLPTSASNLMEDGITAVKGLAKGTFSAVPRCPHMGCSLEWNPDESSWDCPCHGSRFTADGRLIDNPALEGFTKK